jgi:hypothetical protein
MTRDLKIRTKEYALSVIRLFAELPKRTEAQIMGRPFRHLRRRASSFRRFEILETWKFPLYICPDNGLNGAKRLNGWND